MGLFSKKEINVIKSLNDNNHEQITKGNNKLLADQVSEAMRYALEFFIAALDDLCELSKESKINETIITKYNTKNNEKSCGTYSPARYITYKIYSTGQVKKYKAAEYLGVCSKTEFYNVVLHDIEIKYDDIKNSKIKYEDISALHFNEETDLILGLACKIQIINGRGYGDTYKIDRILNKQEIEKNVKSFFIKCIRNAR